VQQELTLEKRELLELMKLPGNNVCVDCDSPSNGPFSVFSHF
jgi:hypothetical protein